MGYGLKVKNDSGEIQIDGNYRNLCLESSGVNAIVNNQGGANNFYLQVAIAASTRPPLIALRPDNDRAVCMVGYGKTGANYDKFRLTTTSGQQTEIDWKCFRETSSPSAEDYGLRVYDPSSNLVYDSGRDFFKIVSVTSIDISASQNAFQDVTHAGVSNPYYILSPQELCVWTTSGGGGLVFWIKAGIMQLTATSVRVKWEPFGVQPGGPADDWICVNGLFKLLVVN